MRTGFLLVVAGLALGAAGPPKPAHKERTVKPPFSITISAQPDVFKVGSPMPVAVVLRNTSSHSIRLVRLSWCNYTAEIRDSEGALVSAKPMKEKLPDGSVLRRHAASSAMVFSVDPGKTADDNCTNYNLNDDYQLTRPGKYTVRLLRFDDETRDWVRSNPISIEVLPKERAQVTVDVWDPSEAVIPRAKVEYRMAGEQDYQYVCAGNDGSAILSLESGNYDLRVSSLGFRTQTRRLEVTEGESQTLKLTLQVGGCTQCVTVMNTVPVFQITNASLSVPDASNQPVQFEKALRYYESAVKADPSNAGLHNSLGIAYANWGQVEQARAEFKKAAELDPAGATHAYYNLGIISFPPALLDKKIEYLRKAIDLDPANADAYQWLGISLMGKSGKVNGGRLLATPDAVQALETYLKLKPDGPYVSWDKQIIKEGEPFTPPDPCAQ